MPIFTPGSGVSPLEPSSIAAAPFVPAAARKALSSAAVGPSADAGAMAKRKLKPTVAKQVRDA